VILARLAGGLGNQMFQYSAARRLADWHDTELVLDLTWFEVEEPLISASRPYGLESFPVRARTLTEDERKDLLALRARIASRLRALRSPPASPTVPVQMYGLWTERVLPVRGLAFMLEARPGFDPRIFDAPDDSYLVGYWQSARYFEEIGDAIRRDFTPTDPHPDEGLIEEIRNATSISVHVRRGDYAASGSLFEVLPKDYYLAAFELVESRIRGAAIYFVFSDDSDWCKGNLRIRGARFVDTTHGSGARDLQAMALCDHHIVANSSFSWWAAWLAENPQKIVVAPRRWTADPRVENPDLVPQSWVRIRSSLSAD
jgi:hypothetical protein